MRIQREKRWVRVKGRMRRILLCKQKRARRAGLPLQRRKPGERSGD